MTNGGEIPSREELLRLCECDRCPLRGQRPVFGNGPERADVVIVGEAPGRTEAQRGVPFSGPSGSLLNDTLKDVGTPRETIYVTNTVLCRSQKPDGGDGPPPRDAVRACAARLRAEITARSPRITIAMGGTAAQVLLESAGTITELQGDIRWDDDYGMVTATYHPAAVLHGNTRIFTDIYRLLTRVSQMTRGVIPMPEREDRFEHDLIVGPENALATLQEILEGAPPEGVVLGLDIETSDLDVTRGKLLTAAIGTENYGVTLRARDMLHPSVIETLRKLLRSPNHTWAFHNMNFDAMFLKRDAGEWPLKYVDTIALGLCIDERLQANGLKLLARTYTGAPYYEEELKQYLPSKKTSYAEIPLDVLARYNARDSVYTTRLYRVLSGITREDGTYDYAHRLLMPAQLLFAKLELHGMRLDMQHASFLEGEWLPHIKAAEAQMKQYASGLGFTVDKCRTEKYRKLDRPVPADKPADQTFNVRSHDHMAYLCHDVLKMRPGETGPRSCDAAFMAANEGHDFIKLLKRFRELDHLHKAFVKGIVDDVKDDGRVHAQHMFGTVTGRLTVYNPPMQTIPKMAVDPVLAKLVRSLFLPDEGCVFVNMDAKQAEVRAAAYLSQDENMIHDCSLPNLHGRMASASFRIPLDQVTKLHKHWQKFITFGIMYNRGAYSLATQELNCSVDDAQRYIDNFFARYPKFHQWWLKQKRDVVETGILRSPLGRMRRWDLITDELIHDIESQAVNFPVQHVANDWCLIGGIRVQEFLERERRGHLHFMCHDAIAGSFVQDRYLDETLREARRIFVEAPHEITPNLNVPIECDVEIGPCYGDLHDWED